jgi:hypothetical protein
MLNVIACGPYFGDLILVPFAFVLVTGFALVVGLSVERSGRNKRFAEQWRRDHGLAGNRGFEVSLKESESNE